MLFIEKINNLPFISNESISALGSYDNPKLLTHEQGRELEFSVTKDGQWLAYVKEEKDRRSIVLTNLKNNSQSILKAPAGEKYTSPTFSPDGTAMIYLWQNKSACNIYQTHFNLDGFIQEDKSKITDCGLPSSWMTINYSKDGQSIFFAKSNSLSDPYKIYMRDLISGYERSITSPTSSGRGDYSFSISQDGNTLTYIRNIL